MSKEDTALAVKYLGSTEPFAFIKEAVEEMERMHKHLEDTFDDVVHVNITDLDTFKAEIEAYAKENPDMDIKASGFIFKSKKGEDPELETYQYGN